MMVRILALLTLAVSLAAATNVAAMPDDEEALNAFHEWLAARNAGDAEALANRWADRATIFEELFLVEWVGTTPEKRAELQLQFEGGRRDRLVPSHMQARIVNNVGIVTGYLSGSLKASANEPTRQGPWQVTSLWVRERGMNVDDSGSRLAGIIRGEWKLFHLHMSPISRPQP